MLIKRYNNTLITTMILGIIKVDDCSSVRRPINIIGWNSSVIRFGLDLSSSLLHNAQNVLHHILLSSY